MTFGCICGTEFFSEVSYRLHVQRKHVSTAYDAWRAL